MGFTTRRTLGRAALTLLLLSIISCYHYRPQPLLPPALEQQYRSRTLADSGLKEFVEAQPGAKPAAWPCKELTLDTLTLVALYFHPDLDAARARLSASEGAVITARTKPNPNLTAAGGYTNADRAPYAFQFALDWTIETAGKRTYRTNQAQNLLEASRIALGETAWQIHSRVRAAFLDHLLASRELDALRQEQQTRTDELALYDERLQAGEISQPEADVVRTALMLLDVTIQRATALQRETRIGLETALGLAPGGLDGVQLRWDSFESPPGEDRLPLTSVQRAGLLNRLDVQRLLAEYAASENALQLEAARQYPDIHLAPSYEFMEGFNSYLIGPSLLLPLRDRNKGPIAEAEARRKEAAARFLSRQAAAIDQMSRALIRYRAALADFGAADSRLKALLQDRERAVQEQIQAGEADQVTLAGVRLEAVAATHARLNALRDAQTALGALEDAVQYPLENGIGLRPVPPTNPRRTP